MQQQSSGARAEELEEAYKQLMTLERKDRAVVEAQYGSILQQAYQRAASENRPLNEVLKSLTSGLARITGSIGRSRRDVVDTWIVLISDPLFVSVPFIVTGFVFWHAGKFRQFPEISEWAFAAAILTGQTITKFISGILGSRISIREPRVTFFITIVMVFGVVPSLLVLVTNLLEKEVQGAVGKPLSRGLIYAQLVMFVIAVVFYIILGGVGEYLKMRKGQGSVPQEK